MKNVTYQPPIELLDDSSIEEDSKDGENNFKVE